MSWAFVQHCMWNACYYRDHNRSQSCVSRCQVANQENYSSALASDLRNNENDQDSPPPNAHGFCWSLEQISTNIHIMPSSSWVSLFQPKGPVARPPSTPPASNWHWYPDWTSPARLGSEVLGSLAVRGILPCGRDIGLCERCQERIVCKDRRHVTTAAQFTCKAS